MGFILKICLALFIISCATGPHNSRLKYKLTDQHGATHSRETLNRHFTLVYFGFARCQTECPLALHKMSNAIKKIHASKQSYLQVYFVTIDPDHDTFEQMKNSISSNHPNVLTLRGSMENIQAMARDFRFHFIPPEGDNFPSHSDLIFLVGRYGQLIATFNSEENSNDISSRLQRAILEN